MGNLNQESHAVADMVCSRLRDHEGEPRVRDVDLGEWLGFQRPRRIRGLIKEHIPQLLENGSLPRIGANPDVQGGRPSAEYWLNEKQALLICTKCETPKAQMVQNAIVAAFVMLRKGQLQPSTTTAIVATQALYDVAAAMRDLAVSNNARLDKVETDIQVIGTKIERLDEKVDLIANTQRYNPKRRDRQEAIDVSLKRYAGMCCCCEFIRIINHDGTVTEQFSIDHFNGRTDARAESLWPVCRRCNDHLRDPQFKRDHTAEFAVYQKRRMQGRPEQLRLIN